MNGLIALFVPLSAGGTGPPSPLWDSDNIRVRDTRETNLQMIGGHVNPMSGVLYYVYVKVTNIGSGPIGPLVSPAYDPAGTVYLRRFRVNTMPNSTDYTDLDLGLGVSVHLDAHQSL